MTPILWWQSFDVSLHYLLARHPTRNPCLSPGELFDERAHVEQGGEYLAGVIRKDSITKKTLFLLRNVGWNWGCPLE